MSLLTSLRAFAKLRPLVAPERTQLLLALSATLLGSILTLLAPYIVGRTIDGAIRVGSMSGVWRSALALLIVYGIALGTSYAQMIWMGSIGQRVLFRLRNQVFGKLQELSVAFFSESKAGDLISRINNDTDKLNQFFSEFLMRFVGSVFFILGAAVAILALDLRLGALALLPAVALIVGTQSIGGWLKQKQAASLQATGSLSAEIQEYLTNFQVVAAFNRRDLLKRRFDAATLTSYQAATRAGIANGVLVPTYDLSAQIAQLITISVGIAFIGGGSMTIGTLVGFLLYVERFYSPFRQMAMIWSNLQVALAGWDRLSEILARPAGMPRVELSAVSAHEALMEFADVSLTYANGKQALQNASFQLHRGKTYALVGPTGGGKTTTASLMARLLDPSTGNVFFAGRDLRSYTPDERTGRIGFILQEPYLFSGTVAQNVVYGHPTLAGADEAAVLEAVRAHGLESLLTRFDQGLATPAIAQTGGLSLGQRQLVAFMRAILREPELLILDEATANIDTVTEQLLQTALDALPSSTTKVVIAHRLNTIQSADEIFFVNDGKISAAGSFEHALELLLHEQRRS
jgi:ATP-binding cassette subfamily B protein